MQVYGEMNRHTEAVATAERAVEVLEALPDGVPFEQQKHVYERLIAAKEKVTAPQHIALKPLYDDMRQ